MLTEKDYCDYETCVALKALGFSQYHSHRVYAGEGGVWILNFEGEPNYNEGELILQEDLFDVPRDGNEVAAPLLYEAQKWLREEKHFFVEIQYRGYIRSYGYEIYNSNRERLDVVDGYKTYEESLSEGIKECIKLLQHGNN